MQDVREAFRTLRATPLVSMAAVLSLALGIGANTAIFSILNSLLLRPLPVRDPYGLVAGLSFAAAAVTLFVTAAFAGWLPARRAARIDPMIVLRDP
jgi:ABC-type antimicrobial peptide transport system permease subunit